MICALGWAFLTMILLYLGAFVFGVAQAWWNEGH